MASAVLAAVVVSGAVFFAAGSEAHPFALRGDTDSVVDVAPCCLEIVAATPIAFASGPSLGMASFSAPSQMASASRWRVVHLDVPQLLAVGVAPERGLQVKTILTARAISAAFPEIRNIGGVRPDSLRWHPDGLALDVMIPNPGNDEGIALGNAIVAFVMKNATRFGIQDAIWRGTYYTPNGPRGMGYGHYDHVHVTTTGGGYPTGAEIYLR